MRPIPLDLDASFRITRSLVFETIKTSRRVSDAFGDELQLTPASPLDQPPAPLTSQERGLAARKACETASRVVKSGKGSGMKFGWPDISPHAPPHSPSAGTGAGKPREPWRAALLTALERCDARLAELRAQGITRRLSLEKLSQFYAFYGALHALADFLAREDMVSADA